MSKQTYKKIGIWILTLLVIVVIAQILIKKKIGDVNIPDKEIPAESTREENTVKEEVSFLKLPNGFKAFYFAKNIPGARVMEWDPNGRMIISQTGEGKISVIEEKEGAAPVVKTLIDDLDSPHGMMMKCNPVGNPPCHLYVAQHDELSRYAYDAETVTVSQYTKLLDLPKSATDRHKTRTLLWLGVPDEDTLLISVGSSCNVCDEGDTMRGKIMAYNMETKEVKEYARGLRNAVFMTLNPINGMVFLTEMGRDGLGDDIPPDEINVIEPARVAQEGAPNFGWPICYGQNIHDTEFDKKTYIRNPCMDPFETPAWQDLQAHSAPLGLSFIPEEGWPEEYWFDLLVAYHGSWNRSEPTGYKIVKIGINGKGDSMGVEDFITGWLTADGKKLGRPADIKVVPGGVIYISDDVAGVIYRVEKTD